MSDNEELALSALPAGSLDVSVPRPFPLALSTAASLTAEDLIGCPSLEQFAAPPVFALPNQFDIRLKILHHRILPD